MSASTPDGRSLSPLAAHFDALFQTLGLRPRAVARGVSYWSSRTAVVRIDPKPQKGCLRIRAGESAELAAPPELRGHYRQRGWLVVWPQHRDLAADYVLRYARARLSKA